MIEMQFSRYLEKRKEEIDKFNRLSMQASTGRMDEFPQEFINFLPPSLRDILKDAMAVNFTIGQGEIIVGNRNRLPLGYIIAVIKMTENVMDSVIGIVKEQLPDKSKDFEDNIDSYRTAIEKDKENLMKNDYDPSHAVQIDENKVVDLAKFSDFINSFVIPAFRRMFDDWRTLNAHTEKEFAGKIISRLGKREKKEKEKEPIRERGE